MPRWQPVLLLPMLDDVISGDCWILLMLLLIIVWVSSMATFVRELGRRIDWDLMLFEEVQFGVETRQLINFALVWKRISLNTGLLGNCLHQIQL